MTAEIIEWVDADGGVTVLDADWPAQGRFMPPITVEQIGVPRTPGGVLLDARHGVREMLISFWIIGTDEADLRVKLRDIVRKLNPAKGPGYLRATAPDGVVRQIQCINVDGVQIQEELGESSGYAAQKIAAQFKAYNPYWQDVSAISPPEWSTGVTPTFFPIFPIRLTSSEIAVDGTIDNAGDVEAWPVWTITGPGSGIVLRNLSTGEYLSFPDVVMGEGQTLYIDTRPGVKTVTLDTNSVGTNMFGAMYAGSSLWPLVPGSNAIRLEMAGITVGTSKLAVSYTQQYLTP
ncbi:phage distal tail protein [Amycolatopsis thermoflava]|uniref:phage distal tail protein n=1 Tax=Amycolatopsis thermoflava TaxID=84480 RepID=UPI00040131E0|nr:phage tail domain-containing protein [Amycolatopsis thermoflava]